MQVEAVTSWPLHPDSVLVQSTSTLYIKGIRCNLKQVQITSAVQHTLSAQSIAQLWVRVVQRLSTEQQCVELEEQQVQSTRAVH